MTEQQARDWAIRHAEEMERRRAEVETLKAAINKAIFDLLAMYEPYKAFPKAGVKNVVRDLEKVLK